VQNNARVTQLENELSELRAELTAMQASATATPVSSRRSALKLAAATALGAIGSTTLVSQAAAAPPLEGDGIDEPGVVGTSDNSDGVSGTSQTGAGVGGEGDVGGRFTGSSSALYLASSQGHQSPLEANIAGETGYLDVDENGNFWACVTGGFPAAWRKLAGPDTAGAFHALSPIRVYDSRQALPLPGVLGSGQNRTISVKDARAVGGGAVTITDAVPAGATAVAANITIASASGGGYLAVNPGGNTVISASTINWSAAGQVLANGVILTVNNNRQLTIICDGGGSTHVIVDITGYFL
jgi:hypothetical protein